MTDRFRLSIGQLNPTVGAIAANCEQARVAWQNAKGAGSDMIALPEMFVTGYQTQDLVMKRTFVAQAMEAVQDLATACATGPALGIGTPWYEDGKVFNCYAVCEGGKITLIRKHVLANDGVFDEKRLFQVADIDGPYIVGPVRIGTPICEDSWWPDVAETLSETGAEILLVPNGSPYHRGKFDTRLNLMVARVVETGLPLVYLNMVGGQDDQVFDGGSFVLNSGGALAAKLPVFETQITHLVFERTASGWRAVDAEKAAHPQSYEQDYRVMVEGLRDYTRKTGFEKVILGLSGGVDSALVATIAADALGPENVRCVMLPSQYTSAQSLEDAAACARLLGVRHDTVPITGPQAAVTDVLADLFVGTKSGLTEENIQSRLRGVLLMALSNKFGEMLLTTGNKSEVAVGYATIYGDMAGGYNPIKDLYKTRVFETCRWRNQTNRPWMAGPKGEVIPPQIIDKPPSAELRPDQKDEDSLPPYDVLDAILHGLVDRDASVSELVAEGFDRAMVKNVEHLIYVSEYKRFQAAPGPRLTPRAFWLDRRYPIVNQWRDPT